MRLAACRSDDIGALGERALPKWPSNAIGKVADDVSVGRDGPSRRFLGALGERALPEWLPNAIGKVADDGSVGRDGPSRRPARHTCPTGRAETRGRTGIIYYWVEIRSGHALWEMSATMRTTAEKKQAPVENELTRRLSQMKDIPHPLSKSMKRNHAMKTERPDPFRPHPPVFILDPAAVRDLVSGLRLASA